MDIGPVIFEISVVGFIWKLPLDMQKHATTKSQLEAQELENKNVKDVISVVTIVITNLNLF